MTDHLRQENGALKKELAEVWPLLRSMRPGAEKAIEYGCTCCPEANDNGRGLRTFRNGLMFDVDPECPIAWHGAMLLELENDNE